MIKEERFNSLYKKKVGDVILLHKSNSSVIEFISNNLQLKFWAIVFLSIGVYILSRFGNPFDPFIWQALIFELIILLAFSLTAYAYWRRSKQGVFLKIDLNNRQFKFKKSVIPYSAIQSFSISYLTVVFRDSENTSYQLNLLFHNNQDYTLIRSECEYDIYEVARYLSKETGIKLSKNEYAA